ncbi:MAG TPA: portal protein [Candidatus Obscuribacterales bacterium]
MEAGTPYYGDGNSLGNLTMRKYRQMLTHRDGMRNIIRLLSKFILLRNAWFGDSSYPNRVVRLSVTDVSDDTAIDASRSASTAFAAALWPNAEESFEAVPHPLMRTSVEGEALLLDEEVKRYYDHMTHKFRQPFAEADSNFLISWGEHWDEQIVLGTSGIYAEEDEYNDEIPCRFKTLSIETCVIDEGPDHRVDTFAMEYTWTVRMVVEKYGIENCSAQLQELYGTPEGQDSYVKIICMVRPRTGISPMADKREKKNKPYAYICMEVATLNVLYEGGLDELSGFMARFRKRPGELYGRSLAMDALPTVKEQNVLRRGFSLALGKQLDPPIGFRQDQLGGAGTVDISMGAKVPIYDTGVIPQSRPPVEPLITVPEPRVANERMTNIEEKINQKFLLDKLLDFNNKTRMTLGEAQLRTDFRNQALGNLFARQMTEILHPLIMWVIRLYWRRGFCGLHPVKDFVTIQLMKQAGQQPLVMPKPVADFYDKTGKLPFAIRFTSPAARAMRADALMGLEKLTNFVLALVTGGAAEAMDNLDVDETVRLYQHHVGAPNKALLPADKRDKARKIRQQAQANIRNLEAQEQQSVVAKNQAKAAKDNAQAGVGQAPQQQGALNIGAA